MDATAMFAEQAQAGTDAAAAAMSAGMSAEQDRRSGYHADMLPAGASYGDEMALPVVPAYATVAGDSGDYPWQGDEPTPAG